MVVVQGASFITIEWEKRWLKIQNKSSFSCSSTLFDPFGEPRQTSNQRAHTFSLASSVFKFEAIFVALRH